MALLQKGRDVCVCVCVYVCVCMCVCAYMWVSGVGCGEGYVWVGVFWVTSTLANISNKNAGVTE